MWTYLRPSCPNRPFSVELGDAEMNTQIQGVLADGFDLNFCSTLVPLREGVDNPWVSPPKFTFIYLYQFLLLNTCTFSTPSWRSLPLTRRAYPVLELSW
jgi:hypothetical protein